MDIFTNLESKRADLARLIVLAIAIAFLHACGGSGDDSGTVGTPTESGERSTADRADEVTGPAIHLLYVLPSDGVDRQLDTNGTIQTSFGAAEQWLRGQTGGRSFRLDTFDGESDISFFRLSQSDAEMQEAGAFVRDNVEADLKDAGFDSEDKIYAVYYDGGSTAACGAGAFPPLLPGNVAILYLRGTPSDGAVQCGENDFAADVDSPVFWEYVVVHEIVHTLGFVPECAPNAMDAHIAGPPNDLMYEGEEETDLPKALDVGHDDYYGHSASGCADFEDSAYLTP